MTVEELKAAYPMISDALEVCEGGDRSLSDTFFSSIRKQIPNDKFIIAELTKMLKETSNAKVRQQMDLPEFQTYLKGRLGMM